MFPEKLKTLLIIDNKKKDFFIFIFIFFYSYTNYLFSKS